KRRVIYSNDELGDLGRCSGCGGNDGSFDIGSSVYLYCKKHKNCWCYCDTSPDCSKENKEIWKKNSIKFYEYERISGFEWIDNKIQSENLDIEKDIKSVFEDEDII
ncbi:MAG: hypothetical protein O6940_07640, partial [Ignavibacteria bacterium]|nr:hypothetical protein [Ignavibacteria bacterium]